MKIAVVHWAYPPVIGGVEMHLYVVCPEMIKQGSEVYALVSTLEGSPEHEVMNGVDITRCPEMNFANLRVWRKEGKDIYSLAKKRFDDFLDTRGIEAVMAHNLHIECFDLSRALCDACQQRGIPCSLVMHNHEFPGLDEEEMWKIVGRAGWNKLIPISKFIEHSMQSRRPDIPREKYLTILHGIDIEKFKPASEDEKKSLRKKYGFGDRKVVLHPARMGGFMKGVVQAMKAMTVVKEKFPDALLVFTGRAKAMRMSEREEREVEEHNRFINNLIKKLGIEANVHIGDYKYEDIPKLTQVCDCLIYPTIVEEAFGLCPVEGMACGVPVVVTKSGGMVESVVDSQTGFIISKDKHTVSKDLGNRIVRIFSDPMMARELGRNGRLRAEEIFDKKRMARDFINLCKNEVINLS
jgi:glycosyltransferase involved in cell wall biosynthesis